MGILKFTAWAPLGHYTFLCKINTFGEKSREKMIENEKLIFGKSTIAVNNFDKKLHLRHLAGL